ncbi:MAG: CDF family Co(II)/Ni(II) efflux transporter DmeF [Desulfatibacillaceae bacterium]
MDRPSRDERINQWCHGHDFTCERLRGNERRTKWVIALTATMMVVEVASGIVFGSMALLADGWHMASHAAALSITALGYFFARKYAEDPRFSFGTGKVGDLAGYSSALVLALIALLMAYESIKRLVNPVDISFDEAIAVAVIGLVVNVVSALLLKDDHGHDHGEHQGHEHHADYNLRAAYIHVLADALTSLLAIGALTGGRFLGWGFLDPLMGVVGAVIILVWAKNLARDTGAILLDMRSHGELADNLREAVEAETDATVTDLHVWRIGPGSHSVILAVVADKDVNPSRYREILSRFPQLAHLTIEVNEAG